MAITGYGSMAEEDEQLRGVAQSLEAAVVALLDPRDAERQQLANQWVSAFVSKPEMWTVALYLAFPPDGSGLGRLPEVKFFVLNLLLSKLRSDWVQLDQVDADEIFEVLVRQLPKNVNDRAVASRVCVVVSAAAAVAGADACSQLVNTIVEGSDMGSQSALALAIDLLTALAEETLHRPRTLPWEVGQCMQLCYPQVLSFLQTMTTTLANFELQAKAFTCVERWIQAGVTLSEIYSDYQSLFSLLLNALGSQDESCVVASSSTLSELISAVDLLPSRDAAVRAVMSAVLGHKAYFTGQGCTSKRRSHALCSLITAIGCAESALIFKGGPEELLLLDWIVDATGGGGGLGIEGATMAAEVWPRLAAIPSRQLVRGQIFMAAAQAVLKVATYPSDSGESDIDEDDFYGFRGGVAEDALAACFKELGSTLLGFISDKLVQATIWQDAEVYLYAVSSLCQYIAAVIDKGTPEHQEQITITAFLKNIFGGAAGVPTLLETVSTKWPHGKLVETAAMTTKGFAEWIALDPIPLEKAVNYTLTALTIQDAKAAAAAALRELCRASAPHLAAARALSPLMGACEQAIATSLGGLHTNESIALIEGLAAVAAALPVGEAEATVASLTVTAVTTIKELSPKQDKTAESADAVGTALKVITAVVDSGVQSNSHPAIPVLQDIWAALDMLATNWSGNLIVATALCDLWGMLASRIGVMMQDVLPKVVCIVADMFKQHLVPACVDCLSNIVPLASSQRASPEVEVCLVTALGEVTNTIGKLELMVENQQQARIKEVNRQDNAVESLGAICSLGASCFRYSPSIFVPSTSFTNVFHCALGLLQRGNSEPPASAANFLSQAIFCSSMGDKDCWQLPPELVTHVDRAVTFSITPLIETVLKLLAHGQLTVCFKEALADVLYSLAVKHTASTEAVMLSFLNSSRFPARPGVLNEATKKQFVLAVNRRPPHTRRVFQELVADFSRVCQALSPAEVLFEY